ncbi:MAG: hypothetical protein E7218_01810 [Anaerofustis stercorihominis]|nr:hypothetical protein [Anaerofustis stercorihominis]
MGRFTEKRIIPDGSLHEFLEDITLGDIHHISELINSDDSAFRENFSEACRYISAAAKNVALSAVLKTANSNSANFDKDRFIEDALSEVALKSLKNIPPKFTDRDNLFMKNTGNFISYLGMCANSAISDTLKQYGIVLNPEYKKNPENTPKYIHTVSVYPETTDDDSDNEGILSHREYSAEDNADTSLMRTEKIKILMRSFNTLLGFEKEAPYKTLSTLFSVIIFPFMKKSTSSLGNYTPVFRKYADSRLYRMRNDANSDIRCLFVRYMGYDVNMDEEISFACLDDRLEIEVPAKFRSAGNIPDGQKYKDTFFKVFGKEKDMYDWAKSSMKKVHKALYAEVKDYL